MRLREILAGDRLREKDLIHSVDMDLENGNTTLHTGKAHVGTPVAEDLRQTRKAELRSIFKRPPVGISSLLLSL